ncbi:MAG: acetate--CoA ligase family protein, partial [Pseudomonadota bacterium]
GILTEILRDSQTLMIPAPAAEVRAALLSLGTAPLLTGFRGRPKADLTAVVAAVMAVQAYAVTEADRLWELEINPLIVTQDRAVAADALIRLALEAGSETEEETE